MKIAIKTAPEKRHLEDARNAGFRFVELYTSREFLSGQCIELAKKFPFEYSVHAPVDCADESAIDFAHAVGSSTLIVHFSMGLERLKELCEYAKKLGIVVCVENSVGNEQAKILESNGLVVRYRKPNTAREFLEIEKQVPGIRMNLDMEHAMLAGVFPDIIRELGKRIGYVHITGYPPNYHSPPFENPAAVRKALEELKRVGYSGFITAETDLKYQNLDTFRKIREFMKKVLKEINQKSPEFG